MSYISAFGIATPANRFSQLSIAEFMVRAMALDDRESRVIRAIFKASGIENRHSVLDDYGKTSEFQVYPNGNDAEFPSTGRRIELYREFALPLSIASINNLLKTRPDVEPDQITHLIVVSCTGMYAPGLDIDIIKSLKLPKTIDRLCINFMGCYAAFNALKAADAFCRSDRNAKVLIVCTELCSLHFQNNPSEDNFLANALFADGSASILVEADSKVPKKLLLEKFHNDLALNGEGDMSWSIGNQGFEMRLSSYIPDLIKNEIRAMIDSLLEKIGKQKDDIKYFAFHPGGKRILQAIDQELNIGNKNSWAYQVLEKYGNMSSPTVVFVLKEIFDQLTREDHLQYILSGAFGPGLTLETMLLKAEVI